MDLKVIQSGYTDWTFHGEGKVHIICRRTEVNIDVSPSTRNHSDTNSYTDEGDAIERSIFSDLSFETAYLNCRASTGNCSSQTYGTYSEVRIDYEHQVLRLTKKHHSREKIAYDQAYLNFVIKPWLSPIFCSQRSIVSLSTDFLQGSVSS